MLSKKNRKIYKKNENIVIIWDYFKICYRRMKLYLKIL